jgi:hypothetical protein
VRTAAAQWVFALFLIQVCVETVYGGTKINHLATFITIIKSVNKSVEYMVVFPKPVN